MGYVSPSYEYNVIYALTQRYFFKLQPANHERIKILKFRSVHTDFLRRECTLVKMVLFINLHLSTTSADHIFNNTGVFAVSIGQFRNILIL